MTVSPFTPLFFNVDRKVDGRECDYIQTFSTTDRILLELIGSADGWDGEVQLIEEPSGNVVESIHLGSWAVNDDVTLYFATICLNPGVFSVYITDIGQSQPFRVTNSQLVLGNTTLIQYSMRNNRQRKDAVFFIDGMQYFFDFRVPGGFQDKNWQFSVESEQFVTPFADISQLYGLESTQRSFTLGHSQGCPVWFGEMLNRILVCDHVYFDGVKYTRKESSVPEIAQALEGVNSFVFTQSLQQSVNLDPTIEETNQAIIRRVDDSIYRVVDTDDYLRLIY